MSANAEDEAKARLEVAQLYEEMGQGAKAVRYLIAAAEIYRDRGDQARMREVYQRVLAIEPNNAQATRDLGAAQQAAIDVQRSGPPPDAGASPARQPNPGPTPTPVAAGAAPVPTPQGGRRGVLVPTPWVGRDPKFLAAVRAQVTAPPDKMLFPFHPLPRINDAALAAKAEARREKEAVEARKNQKAVSSDFANRESRFAAPGAAPNTGLAAASASSTPSTPRPSAEQPAASGSRFAPAGDIKGGNRDLADLIRKRMEGKS